MQALQNAIEHLKQNKTGVFKLDARRLLAVTPNAVLLRSTDDRSRAENNFEQQILAVRANGAIVGNSDRIRDKESKDIVNDIQRPLSDMIPMIPFGVMQQAGLKLSQYKEIERGTEETVYVEQKKNWMSKDEFEKVKHHKDAHFEKHNDTPTASGTGTWKTPRHFTGARLFSIGTECFLMDIDRQEIVYGIFNPFLVKLLTPCTTIQEAYERLKPQDVKDAELQGLDVKRQGEWFMIPTPIAPMATPDRGALRAGDNRPNWVEEYVIHNNMSLVRGKIEHSGREHKTIKLAGWHIAIPNTSITSWQLNGDID